MDHSPAPHAGHDRAEPVEGSLRRIEPAAGRQAYFLLNSIVVPRPIAWVSSVDGNGRPNLAPHSYFTVASDDPPIVSFTSLGEKDTVRNVRATGSFVVHVADRQLAQEMNHTSIDAPPEVSEFELAGLRAAASERVPAPRVVGAPVAMECELERIVEVGNRPAYMVLGRIVLVHAAERLFDDLDRIDAGRLDAIARMGGAVYATTADRFEMHRPRYGDGRASDPDSPSPASPTTPPGAQQ